ncbi:tautomerase family protein [Streptomyces sp. NPDC058595]|uniref:tautomerase family protein n=1 Tax=Streptomyces sp. NPDC058595 TaxID=3346550 RepID=UPI0036655805
MKALAQRLMPFVDITLARGKSDEYLRGVSRAAHDALVEAFGMRPDDGFPAHPPAYSGSPMVPTGASGPSAGSTRRSRGCCGTGPASTRRTCTS